MTRLLLITEDSPQADAFHHALSSAGDFQIHRRPSVVEVRGPLAAGAFEVCLFAPGDATPELAEAVAIARAISARTPLVVTPPADADLGSQTALIAAGADSVLFQPLDFATLAAHLARLGARQESRAPQSGMDAIASPSSPRLNAKAAALSTALEVLRDFSRVLGYSLDYRQLTSHFILKLREVVGISRIAIFLERGDVEALPAVSSADSPHLPCVAAIGLPADLVECFSLTRRSGLGRQLTIHPQILRAPAGAAPPLPDQKIAHEFEVLGGLVAIPINDRERTLGVAVLGGRITGGEFSDEELLLVYHLLEELGLAVKNSWLHHQLVGSHRLFGQVLDSLTIGAAAIASDQRVIYANRALIDFLVGPRAERLEIHDIPAPIASRLHGVVEKGAEVAPFFHQPDGDGGRCFRVSLIPLREAGPRQPRTAMLLLEDFTQIRAAQNVEIESSNLRLISLIARRFAHEIRNSLVPLSTHEQLFDAEIDQPDFRASLQAALRRETRRIRRFTDQMLHLARPEAPAAETVPVEELLRGSFAQALGQFGGEAELTLQGAPPDRALRGDRAALAHAFQEVFLNGLQSGGGAHRRLTVRVAVSATAAGADTLVLTVRDEGAGFTAATVARATEPFYTTRNTGVGLGLTIARQVFAAHDGSLEIHPRTSAGDSDLTIRLPLAL